jgi:hypothetical protein
MTDRQFLRARLDSAAEVADGIEAIYRGMRSAPDDPPAEGGQAR